MKFTFKSLCCSALGLAGVFALLWVAWSGGYAHGSHLEAEQSPCKQGSELVAGKCAFIVPGNWESTNAKIACHFDEEMYETLCVYDPKVGIAHETH